MSTDEVSTDRLMQKPCPSPSVSNAGNTVRVVVDRDALAEVAHAVLVEQMAVAVVGIDHGATRSVEVDVAIEQREHATADRTETDDDDRAADTAENFSAGHANLPRR